jgi:protein involved in polysaccharide export with SLBB domain
MFRSNFKRVVGSLATLFLVSACGPVVKNATPLDSPLVRLPSSGQEYRIQPGDTLDVKFYYNPELNELVAVRQDGRISLQLIPEITATELTPSELTIALREAYSRELRQPELRVIVRAYGERKVYVDGEVNTPGVFDMVGPVTLRQSIARAGGLKETGRVKEVIVIRRIAAGDPVVMTANLQSVNDGTDTGQDIRVVPGDIIYVPRSPIANVNSWVKQYITGVLPFAPSPSMAAF